MYANRHLAELVGSSRFSESLQNDSLSGIPPSTTTSSQSPLPLSPSGVSLSQKSSMLGSMAIGMQPPPGLSNHRDQLHHLLQQQQQQQVAAAAAAAAALDERDVLMGHPASTSMYRRSRAETFSSFPSRFLPDEYANAPVPSSRVRSGSLSLPASSGFNPLFPNPWTNTSPEHSSSLQDFGLNDVPPPSTRTASSTAPGISSPLAGRERGYSASEFYAAQAAVAAAAAATTILHRPFRRPLQAVLQFQPRPHLPRVRNLISRLLSISICELARTLWQ
ncbi:hypothetical protein BJ742DRAFT_444498 [Cladochytrium replicatum]|nr:hypothetical protein BJ742DRAFT_444498 [Cladochytrium replicatum]